MTGRKNILTVDLSPSEGLIATAALSINEYLRKWLAKFFCQTFCSPLSISSLPRFWAVEILPGASEIWAVGTATVANVLLRSFRVGLISSVDSPKYVWSVVNVTRCSRVIIICTALTQLSGYLSKISVKASAPSLQGYTLKIKNQIVNRHVTHRSIVESLTATAETVFKTPGWPWKQHLDRIA